MRFCFNELLLALSYAFDCVEHELIGATTDHSKRVACMCAAMGRKAGYSTKEQADLTACALLHDNALTEYIQSEYMAGKEVLRQEELSYENHCIQGERNIREFPFFGDVSGVILYHHENADGSGPFRKKSNEVPPYARLIHLTDLLDCAYRLGEPLKQEKAEKIDRFVQKNTGGIFDQETADLFREAVRGELLAGLAGDGADKLLQELLPRHVYDFSPRQIMDISEIFARIVDYKSKFTTRHSIGIAEKAYQMGGFYGYDSEQRAKLYLAGALHDIGKLAVDINILEKPGKLTAEEYEEMKKHALISHRILTSVGGFEDIASWGALHHEKLDGSGYPFGYKADKLGRHERLMAVLDIYQALSEERPYKKSMGHEEAMAVLRGLSETGALDGDIVRDIDYVFGP